MLKFQISTRMNLCLGIGTKMYNCVRLASLCIFASQISCRGNSFGVSHKCFPNSIPIWIVWSWLNANINVKHIFIGHGNTQNYYACASGIAMISKGAKKIAYCTYNCSESAKTHCAMFHVLIQTVLCLAHQRQCCDCNCCKLNGFMCSTVFLCIPDVHRVVILFVQSRDVQ